MYHSPIKGRIFSHESKMYLLYFFSLPGALRSHMWISPPPVSDTLIEAKCLCPTLFLNYGHFLSLPNMQSFNWYFVQFSITKFLRKKDKCSRFKSSLSWWLLFLQCTSKYPLKASHFWDDAYFSFVLFLLGVSPLSFHKNGFPDPFHISHHTRHTTSTATPFTFSTIVSNYCYL